MKFGTKAVHAGVAPDPSTGAIMTPIYQTSTYVQEAPAKHKGYAYARGANPTRNTLQKSLAALENGKFAICFSSGMGATDAVIKLLNPGDEVIIPEPFYANYNGFSCAAGVTVKPVQSFIENGFALPPVSEFEKLITPKTKGIMICNPGNPTGYLYSAEELELLKQLVLKYDLFLLSDEVYREFCYDGKKYVSVMHLTGIDNNVVLLDSISKRYSACGARIGALISKNKEVMAAAMKFAQARLSPPTFGQIGAEAALNTPQSYFDTVQKEYVERRDFLIEALNKMEGVFCPKPSGAFYCIARLPIDDADKFCQWLLESFEYENQTVMLAPATGFYSTPGAGINEVRLAYVLNKEALKNAMICLEKALKVYPGRKG